MCQVALLHCFVRDLRSQQLQQRQATNKNYPAPGEK